MAVCDTMQSQRRRWGFGGTTLTLDTALVEGAPISKRGTVLFVSVDCAPHFFSTHNPNPPSVIQSASWQGLPAINPQRLCLKKIFFAIKSTTTLATKAIHHQKHGVVVVAGVEEQGGANPQAVSLALRLQFVVRLHIGRVCLWRQVALGL